jgi:hypothetical protein
LGYEHKTPVNEANNQKDNYNATSTRTEYPSNAHSTPTAGNRARQKKKKKANIPAKLRVKTTCRECLPRHGIQ